MGEGALKGVLSVPSSLPHFASGGPEAPSKTGETEKEATGRLQTSRQSFISYLCVCVLFL